MSTDASRASPRKGGGADLYDPQEFQLRLADGRVFDIDAQRGITRAEDRNGNYVHFLENGLLHSSGRNVQFVRDVEGRITQIIDGGGRSTGYEYDLGGNLVAFFDAAGRRTRYEYNEPSHPHHLTDIIDWRGVRTAAFAYQSDGRLRDLCDADGVCFTSQYDLTAQSMIRFDGLRRPSQYTYDRRGNVTRILDPLGHLTGFSYDPFDNLVRREDPDGAVTLFSWDPYRNLIRQIEPYEAGEDPDDFTTTWTRRPDGRPITQTLPTGGTVQWEYDAEGNETFVRDAAGNVVFARTFNPDGTVATYADRFGTVRYDYGAEGLPTRVTGPDGTITDLAYDIGGNVLSVRRGASTQRFRYDALGRRTSADYGNGATVRYEHSVADDWTAIEGPTFGRVERRVSGFGRLLGWTLPNGDTFSRTYDASGQLRAETDELGNVTRYTYNAAGWLEQTIDEARGATTTFTHDPMGRVLTQTNTLGEVTRTEYDVRGAVRRRIDGRGNATTFAQTPSTSTTTDAFGNSTVSSRSPYGLPVSTTFPGGASTSRTYAGETLLDDSASYPRTIADEMARVRSFTYDPLGVLSSVTDLGGNAWTYAHTPVLGGDVRFDVFSGEVGVGVDEARSVVSRYAGRDEQRDGHRPAELDAWTDGLSRVTSPLGEVTSWSFGAGGQVSRVDYPFGGALTRTFGGDLRVATETRPFGTTVTFTRDVAGRVIRRTGDDGSAHDFDYGPSDRVDSITDGTGTTTYSYDGAGRFEGLDYPSALRFRQGYDALDRVTSVRVRGDAAVDPTEHDTRYTYDPAGNLATVTDPFGRVTTYTYDAANRLSDVLFPNGVHSTYGYDDRSRVVSVVHADTSGGVLASVSYVRADSGEPTRITREDGSYVLVSYDGALRVERERYLDATDTLVEEIAYTYDADGNRTSRTTSAGTETYVYASGSRLERIERGGSTVATYTYDGGGRVTRIARGTDADTLTYDADDHVVAIADEASGTSARFAFDAAGRRVAREERDPAGATTAALRWATAPTLAPGLDSPHLVTTAAGAPVGGYVFDGEHPLARYDASGEPVYYLRDPMGSVIGLVSGDGTDHARIHYDGFGNVRSSTGTLATLPAGHGGDFRFHGMWLDPDAGLYYVRARTYEPESGRFTTRDPHEFVRAEPHRSSPFVLAESVPTLSADPTGELSSTAESAYVTIGLGLLAATAVSHTRVNATLSQTQRPASCEEMYPDLLVCDDLPSRYRHLDPESVLDEIERGSTHRNLSIDYGSEEPTLEGPCVGQGTHYDVVDNRGRKVASIVCCACCEDAGSAPVGAQLCGVGNIR